MAACGSGIFEILPAILCTNKVRIHVNDLNSQPDLGTRARVRERDEIAETPEEGAVREEEFSSIV